MESVRCDENYKTVSVLSPILYRIRLIPQASVTQKMKIMMNGHYSHYTNISNISGKQSLEVPIRFGREKIEDLPLSTFMKPLLPNIHKALSPFYVILVLFGTLLAINIGIITTAVGLYQFVSNLGVFVTAIGATAYVYILHKRANRDRHW